MEEMVPQDKKVGSFYDVRNGVFQEPEGTIFVFRIDETLIWHPQMLGSRAWRAYMKQVAKDWHDIFSYDLANNAPVATVELATCHFVRELQDRGFVVCALTSRGRTR